MEDENENEDININRDINVNLINFNDVKDYFKFQGSPEFADDFFNHYEAQGWVTGSGRRIINWQYKANQWIKREINKPKENKYGTTQRGAITPEQVAELKKYA